MNTPRFTSQTIGAGLGLLLVAIMVLAGLLIVTSRAHQRLTTDLAEINDIKYGLLNANAWVDQVAAIVEKRIDQFTLTPANRKTLKPAVERLLDALITEAVRDMHKQNKSGPWLKRRIKQDIASVVIDVDQIKAGIPRYADRILDEFGKTETRGKLGTFLKAQLGDVSDSTFSPIDQRPIERVHEQYQCQDRPSCQQNIALRIDDNRVQAMQLALAVLGLTALLFIGVCAAPDKQDRHRLWLLAVCCTVLMVCGVLTPMIDVEGKITQLDFVLLGEPVVFTDQVLYFQSKTVLDVVQILTTTGKPNMILVGILITTFCLLFPLAKLVASFVYLYDLRGLRHSAITQFFALKSGKWSMADVFVVSMFMTYVGFNGLTASELAKFASAGGAGVKILTTNGTSLQIGFFMFLVFCLANLATSSLIDAAIRRKPP